MPHQVGAYDCERLASRGASSSELVERDTINGTDSSFVMRNLRSRALCLVLFLLFSFVATVSRTLAATAAPVPFIRRLDDTITVHGAPIKLRGVNLGGMFLWEPWIWGANLFPMVSESEMFGRLQSLVGVAPAQRFRHSIYENYVTEPDIRRISELGFNVVRVPINYRLLENDANPYVYENESWQDLDNLINLCEKHHVYVVIDLHAAAGGQSRLFTADPNPKRFLWRDEENKKRTVALWAAIAGRYKNRTIVAGYDLLNEPNPVRAADAVDLYRDIIKAIREVDKNHMLIVEGTSLATKFDAFDELPDENMIFSFHAYSFSLFGDPASEMRKKVAAAQEEGRRFHVPVWCGEFGENTLSNVVGSAQSLNEAGSDVCGWCLWTWKQAPVKGIYGRMDRTPMILQLPSGWLPLMKWCVTPHLAKRPAAADAQTAMDAFAQCVKFANNKQDGELMAELSKLVK
ncbi:MAG TPA: glycoside hydrolase family 5 protein [Planktothrix sp.]